MNSTLHKSGKQNGTQHIHIIIHAYTLCVGINNIILFRAIVFDCFIVITRRVKYIIVCERATNYYTAFFSPPQKTMTIVILKKSVFVRTFCPLRYSVIFDSL